MSKIIKRGIDKHFEFDLIPEQAKQLQQVHDELETNDEPFAIVSEVILPHRDDNYDVDMPYCKGRLIQGEALEDLVEFWEQFAEKHFSD